LTPVSLPDANRAKQMIAAGIEELVRVEVSKGQAAAEWIDQGSSPLGRRRHLDLVRNGALPGTRSGKLVLVRRADLDAYLAEHATPSPSGTEPSEDAAAVAALLANLGEET